MTSFVADDHAAIRARMEEIAKERQETHEYTLGEPAKEPAIQTYMGWDIYAPVNVNSLGWGSPASIPVRIPRW